MYEIAIGIMSGCDRVFLNFSCARRNCYGINAGLKPFRELQGFFESDAIFYIVFGANFITRGTSPTFALLRLTISRPNCAYFRGCPPIYQFGGWPSDKIRPANNRALRGTLCSQPALCARSTASANESIISSISSLPML